MIRQRAGNPGKLICMQAGDWMGTHPVCSLRRCFIRIGLFQMIPKTAKISSAVPSLLPCQWYAYVATRNLSISVEPLESVMSFKARLVLELDFSLKGVAMMSVLSHVGVCSVNFQATLTNSSKKKIGTQWISGSRGNFAQLLMWLRVNILNSGVTRKEGSGSSEFM